MARCLSWTITDIVRDRTFCHLGGCAGWAATTYFRRSTRCFASFARSGRSASRGLPRKRARMGHHAHRDSSRRLDSRGASTWQSRESVSELSKTKATSARGGCLRITPSIVANSLTSISPRAARAAERNRSARAATFTKAAWPAATGAWTGRFEALMIRCMFVGDPDGSARPPVRRSSLLMKRIDGIFTCLAFARRARRRGR